jgi:hypothetical protein
LKFAAVKKTVLNLKDQGYPDDAIASRIKYETKGKDPAQIIEGIQYENSLNDPKAKQQAAKRDKELKNAIREQEKKKRKMMNSKK